MVRLVIEIVNDSEIQVFLSFLEELGIEFSSRYPYSKLLFISEEDANLFKLAHSKRFLCDYFRNEIHVFSHADL